MNDANVEIVRRSFEAFSRGDFETALAAHHPDVEWCTAADEPDSQVYSGIDGVRRLIATIDEPWENRFGGAVVLGDFVVHGPWVVVPWRARLQGRGSGIEVELLETYAVLLEAGRIVRVDEYRTTEQALDAVRERSG
jgi:ketosteroid isomerase-like protein